MCVPCKLLMLIFTASNIFSFIFNFIVFLLLSRILYLMIICIAFQGFNMYDYVTLDHFCLPKFLMWIFVVVWNDIFY